MTSRISQIHQEVNSNESVQLDLRNSTLEGADMQTTTAGQDTSIDLFAFLWSFHVSSCIFTEVYVPSRSRTALLLQQDALVPAKLFQPSLFRRVPTRGADRQPASQHAVPAMFSPSVRPLSKFYATCRQQQICYL